jgi:phage terminase small subunit
MDTDLNEKQKLFVKYYVSKDFFANGVESYAEAYGLDSGNIKDYNTAKVNASKLLTNTNILAYMRELLDLSGLNDDFVDKELLFVIMQNSDLGSKVKAISEYNKLRQRITDKSKSETTSEITVKYVDGIKPL